VVEKQTEKRTARLKRE